MTPGSRGSGRTGTFASLHQRDFRILWVGGVLTFLSVQMQFVARGWLAFLLTGNNKGLGAIYLAFGVPMLVLTPFGGVAADRLSRRAILLASQVLLTGTALFIALAVQFDFVAYWMLLVSAMLNGAAFSFVGPARVAMSAEFVGREGLPNAIVLQQLALNGTRVFGPAVAGALIGVALFGISGVYFLTTGIACIALVFTARLPRSIPPGDRPERAPTKDLADGISYARNNPILGLLIVTSFIVVMFAFPYVAFLPAIAEEVFERGPNGYGVMSSGVAIGAVAISLVIAGVAGSERAWRLQTFAGLAFGLTVIALGLAPTFVVAMVVMVGIGAGSSAFQSLNNSLLLTSAADEYHGRMQSLTQLSFSGFGIASFPLGALADVIGIRTTLVIMGSVASAMMGVYAALQPRLKRESQLPAHVVDDVSALDPLQRN